MQVKCPNCQKYFKSTAKIRKIDRMRDAAVEIWREKHLEYFNDKGVEEELTLAKINVDILDKMQEELQPFAPQEEHNG